VGLGDDVDPFAAGGKDDGAGDDRPYRLVPPDGAISLEPDDQRPGERLWFQPYAIEYEGTEVNVYRADDAWYEMRRYLVALEEPGRLMAQTETEYAQLLLLWRVDAGSSTLLADGIDHAYVDVSEPGNYGLIVQPTVFPVRTVPEDAYIDYDLTVSFSSEPR